jgi:hypothetical protein
MCHGVSSQICWNYLVYRINILYPDGSEVLSVTTFAAVALTAFLLKNDDFSFFAVLNNLGRD